MTVRTSMEARSRVELTFSFDSEEEATEWIAMFKKATECYAAQEKKKEGNGNSNGPVSKPPGSRSVGKSTKGKRLKK